MMQEFNAHWLAMVRQLTVVEIIFALLIYKCTIESSEAHLIIYVRVQFRLTLSLYLCCG